MKERGANKMENKLILKAYTQMLRIRLTEERLASEYIEKNIRSFVHFYVGQEAVAVGVCLNLSQDDYVFGNHRSHGHYLAKGGDLKKMIAELYGKSTGCSGGRGGSMHLIEKSVGFMGSISILASVVPIAVGAAFSAKKQGKNKKCVVFLGDGASEEGVFYESVNFASLFNIPILFVVENNLYAVMSDRSVRRPESFDFSKVINGLGANYYKSDGNNFLDVYETTNIALNEMFKTMKPSVIEFITFRHMCHSGPVFDDEVGYRKQDDWDTRIKSCPIKNLKNKIVEMRIASPDILNKIEEQIRYEIDDALRYANESPFPQPEDLMEGVYNEQNVNIYSSD
jgi:TPP-dependent pyruvate/acetoin dehydrogenase alpha subunit